MVVTSGGEFQSAVAAPARAAMLASGARLAGPGLAMKKAIVVTLLALAVVVLLSPGIIGKLAERSVDDSFDWAEGSNDEISVTSTGFQRGWFTSAGQHRVELREGELYYLLLGAFGTGVDSMPVLLIDTRLDHGLIPMSSLEREHGSLLPGLGSGVSTLSLELADGSVAPLPGKLYSTIGLTGELRTRLELRPDNRPVDGGQIDWSAAEFVLVSDVQRGSLALHGGLQALTIAGADETVTVGDFGVDLDLAASGHGFMIGPARLTLESLAVTGPLAALNAGPFFLQSESSIDDGRLDATVTLRIDRLPLPFGGIATAGGYGAVAVVARVEGVDAAALGNLKRRIDAELDAEDALLRLLAGGLAVHFDQFDVAGPLGQITSRFSATLAATDADNFSWAAALLALDASADLSLPAALVDMASAGVPELQAAIAMGFLQKKGDFYVLRAAFRQGLLNVNGAPLPIPLTGLY